jgi:hypothetical protein
MDQPVVIQQPDRPQMTVEVPAGWEARERKRQLILTRDGRRVVVRQCRLDRAERDMTGKRAAREVRNGLPVRGGGCLIAKGAPKLRAQLGKGSLPASDRDAERIAREARTATLAAPRVEGTMRAIVRNKPLNATWAWDQPARYFRIAAAYESISYEVVRDGAGGHVRYGERACWGGTPPAVEDDAIEPRLELQELDAPPHRSTTWRLAYQAPRRLPDGTTLLRWDAFVHDGEALVGPDGLLRSVRIRDHGVAEARASWSALDLGFTSFPAAVQPVRPEPSC